MSSRPAEAGLAFRAMRAEDVERVHAIESAAFSTPWSADTFRSLLDRPGADPRVLEHPEDGVIGYAVLWCVLDQGELANLAIDAEHRGGGYGSELLARVLDLARERGVKSMYLEVRASNDAAVGLYRRFGFAEIGVRRGYYERPREDALMMMVRL